MLSKLHTNLLTTEVKWRTKREPSRHRRLGSVVIAVAFLSRRGYLDTLATILGSIPPRGHPSPPPFPTLLSVVHRLSSSLEGADRCENEPRTYMQPKANVREETTRYTSSRSLQKPGESNDSPMLKQTMPFHWKRPGTSQKRLGELDAPQVRSYRTVNGVLHRSLQWESWRDQSRMSRVIRVTNVTFVTNGDADASNSMSDARRWELRPANDPNPLAVACSGLPLFMGSADEAAVSNG